ncbi:MAG: hypothetical protein EAZ78_09380 [Oscillatoriales cyanobacterium]|nr:MAG: hypothetical protein EA000_02670 [Oscillatoriales cyanobacterium]TAD92886.1 MAG: hypothetical protein EAZ98_24730 [Oscillatoriales cyanobacterium]TAD99990.1 MAG: hypothetical protein EAZ96_21990 [Oscillatoriales cyanobacterium]TAF04284.1 MAG: hypothetical protein EAZ78_09380 [Oscillatoriales cyanobacterium]TAF43056.1 MAG: hypothetical protein EAZ68_09020 [Oscillatoriales cyanobacterium]
MFFWTTLSITSPVKPDQWPAFTNSNNNVNSLEQILTPRNIEGETQPTEYQQDTILFGDILPVATFCLSLVCFCFNSPTEPD